jgi:hypothetical protein
MNIVRRIVKRLPSAPALASLEDVSREKGTRLSPLAFLRRRIRLRGNSSVSIPLGVVLIFPCVIIVLIVTIFARHPSSSGVLVPAGSPPSIRFVGTLPNRLLHMRLTDDISTDELAKNMIRSLRRDVYLSTKRQLRPHLEPMPHSSSSHVTKNSRASFSLSSQLNVISTDGGIIRTSF